MKITMTLAEVKQMVAEHYSIHIDRFQFVIDDDTRNKSTEFLNRMARFCNSNWEAHPSQKISMIKTLRDEIRGTGLFQAKQTVENWKDFQNKVANAGRMPQAVNDGWVF